MEKKTNNPAITKSYAKKMETISPFELKNKLIDMADESIKKIAHTMLNAGRGNPNWIATEPREAFFLLGQFGLCECIIRKSKFPQNPKRSVRFSGKRTKRSVQKRKARNTQKAETKVL